jgi:hypothetical protein
MGDVLRTIGGIVAVLLIALILAGTVAAQVMGAGLDTRPAPEAPAP